MRWNGRRIEIAGLFLAGWTGVVVWQMQKATLPASASLEVATPVASAHSVAPDFDDTPQTTQLMLQSQSDKRSQEVIAKPQRSAEASIVSLFTTSAVSTLTADRKAFLPIGFPKSLRSRSVELNSKTVLRTGLREGLLLSLELFSDAVYTARVDRVTEDKNGVVTIRGRIEEYPLGTAILTTSGGRTLGVIDIPELSKKFLIQNEAGSATYHLLDIDLENADILEGGPSLIPPGYPDRPTASEGVTQAISLQNTPVDDDTPQAAAPDAVTVDVMIVYTPAARIWANASGGGIANVIAQAMAKGQLALDNSGTALDLNLVHSAEIPYTETDSTNDISRLQNTSDGYMDAVHSWRDQYQADMVALLAKIEFVGGWGYLLNSTGGQPEYAFSLNRVQQSASTYTVIHEMGHNMGCGHPKAQNYQPGPGLFPFSAGWRWTGSDNGKYCSVMTYEDGNYFADGITRTRVGYFSSPAIQHLGAATGNATDGDNARTIRETAPFIAIYRPALPYAFTVNNGTISITGYTGPGGTAVIPETIAGRPVTSIGDWAFLNCTNLTSVTIPNSVTNIGYNSFGSCSRLTNVTIGNSTRSIGDYAFYNCSSLTNVTLGNSITNIGTQAFHDCASLTRVYFLGNTPSSLGSFVFFGANATIYYLPGTTGWGTTFAERPTVRWLTISGGTSTGPHTDLQKVAIAANAPAVGKAFDRWSGATQYVASVTSSTTTVNMPVQAITLTATYKNSYYTLTVNSGTGGGTTYTNQQRVSITANAPAVGKTFDRWMGATQYVASATASNTIVTMPSQAITLTATYKDAYYSLTVNKGTGGGTTYTNGQRVTITASNAPVGQMFNQWTGMVQHVASVTSSTTTVTMPVSNISVTATYNAVAVLTVVSPYGSPVPAVGIYTNAKPSGLTNSVNSPVLSGTTTQYVCTGWTMTSNSPASGTATSFTMTLTNNATLTWRWSTNYLLTVIATNGTANVSSGWKPAGSAMTITADPDPGYRMGHWLVNGLERNKGLRTLPLTNTAPMTVEIFFQKNVAMPWLQLLLE